MPARLHPPSPNHSSTCLSGHLHTCCLDQQIAGNTPAPCPHLSLPHIPPDSRAPAHTRQHHLSLLRPSQKNRMPAPNPAKTILLTDNRSPTDHKPSHTLPQQPACTSQQPAHSALPSPCHTDSAPPGNREPWYCPPSWQTHTASKPPLCPPQDRPSRDSSNTPHKLWHPHWYPPEVGNTPEPLCHQSPYCVHSCNQEPFHTRCPFRSPWIPPQNQNWHHSEINPALSERTKWPKPPVNTCRIPNILQLLSVSTSLPLNQKNPPISCALKTLWLPLERYFPKRPEFQTPQ